MSANDFTPKITAAQFSQQAAAFLPGRLGIEVLTVEPERVRGRMALRPSHLAPNGFLHAGSVVSLADTLCGCATVVHLPEGDRGFTTIELKSNFFGTLLEGVLYGEGSSQHLGRSMQVWGACIKEKNKDKTLALFRCTNMILYPRG